MTGGQVLASGQASAGGRALTIGEAAVDAAPVQAPAEDSSVIIRALAADVASSGFDRGVSA